MDVALQINFGGIITCDFIVALLFSALSVTRCLKDWEDLERHNKWLVILHILNLVIKTRALNFVSGCERIHSAAQLFFKALWSW